MNDLATSGSICAETEPAGRTLAQLIDSYQTDKVSSYHRLRYQTRRNHANLLLRLKSQHGHRPLSEIRARVIKEMHQGWSEGGKVAVGHAFIAALRTICGYGATDLEEQECERLCLVLHKLRFPSSPPRTTFLTAAQANAIRGVAHDMGWPSIVLTQAIQFEAILRQMDVIGCWVPFKEPGESDVRFRGQKWLRGLRWNEISDDLILTHVTRSQRCFGRRPGSMPPFHAPEQRTSMGILTRDIPEGFIVGLSRRRVWRDRSGEVQYTVSHLYKVTFSEIGQPMCKRGYEAEGDISIWRGNAGPKGICSVCRGYA